MTDNARRVARGDMLNIQATVTFGEAAHRAARRASVDTNEEREIVRLQAALAFYADAKHYENPPYGGLKDIEADGGKIAREALTPDE